MKIRKHRKREYWFYPHEESELKKYLYKFKYKSDLMKFLTNNLTQTINGIVKLEEEHFGGSGALRQWFVWYNQKEYMSGAEIRADLRQLYFRGRKFIHKPSKISKKDKKYFTFSDKVVSLMSRIEDENGNILPKDAKRLLKLFEKRGFKDFEPTRDQWEKISYYVDNNKVDFNYWSDRCGTLRMKIIIEYFKVKNLI